MSEDFTEEVIEEFLTNEKYGKISNRLADEMLAKLEDVKTSIAMKAILIMLKKSYDNDAIICSKDKSFDDFMYFLAKLGGCLATEVKESE